MSPAATKSTAKPVDKPTADKPADEPVNKADDKPADNPVDNSGDKPAGKAGRPKKGEAPEFDLSNLTFAEAELPRRAVVSNPFVKPLGESYEYDSARKTRIPEAALRRVEGLIRRAADELNIGVTIVSGQARDEKGDPIAGQVDVVFRGKERRKRKTKEQKAAEESAAEAATSGDDAPAAGSEPAAEDADSGSTDSPQQSAGAEPASTADAERGPEPVGGPVAS